MSRTRPGRMGRLPASRLLVVQTAFLGDVVLTTPLLRELRRARPHDTLTVITTADGCQALAGLPYVDELLAYDKSWTLHGLLGTVRLLRRLVRTRVGIAVAAQRSARTGMLLRASAAPLCVGFAGAAGAWAYHRRVRWEPGQHAARRYLALASALGGDAARANPQPELVVDPAALKRVRSMLHELGTDPHGALLCVAPGSARTGKRWLPERFAEVVAAAASRGLLPLLIGAPGERELCAQVAARSGVQAAVLAGRTSVRELVALLAASRGLVANDSGAAHVAAAVGTPVVSIFGPTSPAFGYAALGPWTRVVERRELPCRPCDRRGPASCPLGHFRCMREIEAREVLGQLDHLLQARGAHSDWNVAQRSLTGCRPG